MKHPKSQQVQSTFQNEDLSVRTCCSSFRPVSGENEQSNLGLRGGHRQLSVMSHYVSVIDTLNHT